MKKVLLTFLLLSSFLFAGFSQNQATVDSLVAVLPSINDSIKVQVLHDLFQKHLNNNPEKAISYGEQALRLAEQMHWPHSQAKALNDLSVVFSSQGKHQQALEYAVKALQISQFTRDSIQFSEALINIGTVHDNQGKYPEALDHYLQALKIVEASGDKQGMADCLGNLANVYKKQGDLNEAIKYHLEAIRIKEALGNQARLALEYDKVGIIYKELGEYIRALNYYQKALQIYEKINNLRGIISIAHNIGSVYEKQQNYSRALEYFNQSLMLAEEANYPLVVVENLNAIAQVYYQDRQYHQALSRAEQAFAVAVKLQMAEEIKNTTLLLADIHAALRNFQDAYEYHKQHISIRDSLYNEQRLRQVAEMKVRYESERTEQENELLRKENQLKQSQIEQQDLKASMRNTGLGCLVGIIIFIALAYRQIQNTNRLLRQRNEFIQAQNQQIQEANRVLEEQKLVLEELNREKNSMIGIVSHDLKAPLNRINGLLQLMQLESNNLTTNQLQYIQKINRVVRDGSALIQNLLDVRAIEEKKVQLNLEDIDIVNLVADLIRDYEKLAANKEINLHFQSESDQLHLKSDWYSLIRIFDNLLSNAIKFSPAGRNIYVHIADHTHSIRFKVQDEGYGISPADREKLFQRHQRLSNRPTGGESSSGLGLVIVKSLVESLNGKIWCESQKGEGATFYVELRKEAQKMLNINV